MTIGLVTRAAMQAISLVLLSRWLGPSTYGAFAGLVAGAMLCWPFAGWGVTQILVRNVAQEPAKLRSMWARAVWRVGVTGALLVAGLTLGIKILVGQDVAWEAAIAIGLSELVFAPIPMLAANACLAAGKVRLASVLSGVVPAIRMLAIVGIMIAGVGGALQLACWLYLLASAGGAATAFRLMRPIICKKGPQAVATSPEWHGGSAYAASAALGSGYQEIDKVLVLHLLGTAVLGPYSVAFRVATIFTLPVAALAAALLPRIFAESNTPKGRRLLRNSILAAALYGVSAAGAIMIARPLIPFVFGHEFAVAASYLLWLAPWPLLFALHSTCATGLTGCGRQGVRNAVECCGLLAVCALNLQLLSHVGAEGAIWSLLLAEAMMAIACFLLLPNGRPDRRGPRDLTKSSEQGSSLGDWNVQ